MIRKVQVIVYLRKPQLLVLLLWRPPERGHIWQPVTGKIEPEDEDFVEAGRREVLEETGIGQVARVLDPATEFRFGKNNQEVVEHLVGIELESPPPVHLSDEHIDYAWLEPPEALDRLHWEINKEGLRKILSYAGIDF